MSGLPRAPLGGARALTVAVPLLLATAGVVLVAWLAAGAVRSLADTSLESTARAVSFAAERLLAAGVPAAEDFGRLFADRVVAYALVADGEGRVVYHTNPALRGTVVDDAVSPGGAPAGRRVTLGTGRPAWVLDRAVPLPAGGTGLLRVALHTAGVDRMLERVRALWWGVGALLALLWISGALVLALAARSRRLEEEIGRRRSLALVGQMTATLAHEIRNAIGGVKGYAQLAAEKTDPADPRARELGLVLAGVARIERLVGDLLGYAREERGAPRAVDTGALIAAAASAVPGAGPPAVDAPPGLRVLADPEQLERVIVNALRNAAEAAPGGTVRVTVSPRGGEVEILVEDEGPGVPAEDLPRIFTPFYTTKAAGTGLGLAWARKVVEAMGGSITLVNRSPGPGAALAVRLPRAGR